MRVPAIVLAVVLAVAACAALIAGGDDAYTLEVPLRSGYGLKDGSAVRIGGVDRGSVDLELSDDDTVLATLTLDEGVGPVDRDARVSIVAANFLGQKRVDLDVGDGEDPAPSGYRLSGNSVDVPTDLDQVLGVFDTDTRTRARVLISALGEAVVGRRTDIHKLLAELPAGLDDTRAVISQLSTDNATMRALLRRSDGFLAEAADERTSLARLVDVLADTTTTVAAKREELRATLARAPGTLRNITAFSSALTATAAELGPAARELRATAGPLAAVLDELEPVRRAAEPALEKATGVAPLLTRLATRATPVVREAVPNATSLATMSASLIPVSKTLDGSANNLLAILHNWSRAIQFRDGLSHVFRGEAGLTPEAVRAAVDRLGPQETTARRKAPRREPEREAAAPAPKAAPAPQAAPAPAAPERPNPVKELLDELPGTTGKVLGETLHGVEGIVGGLLGGRPADPERGADTLTPLLDHLLGP